MVLTLINVEHVAMVHSSFHIAGFGLGGYAHATRCSRSLSDQVTPAAQTPTGKVRLHSGLLRQAVVRHQAAAQAVADGALSRPRLDDVQVAVARAKRCVAVELRPILWQACRAARMAVATLTMRPLVV